MTCAACQFWRLKDAGQMAKHGFGLCAKQSRARFFPAQHTCTSYAAADADIVKDRAAYLNRRK